MKKSIVLGLALFQPLYAEQVLDTDKGKLSYALGLSAGSSLRDKHIELDEALFVKGVHDGLTNATPLLSKEQTQALLLNLQQQQVGNMAKSAIGIENEAKGAAFMAENGKKEGVVTLPSGLQYKIIKAGTGESPIASSTVTVNYEGSLIDGTVFDSSYKRGQPISFPVTGVIPGWVEALKLMKPGGTWMLYIPAKLAYGNYGSPGAIPAGATLIFKVDLISVK